MRILKQERAGFTLLEVLIAVMIMAIAFGAILMVQSGSLDSSAKTKQMVIIGMLAKNLMVETERKMEGRPFGELKKEEGGTFPEPYQDFQWKREVKEVKLPDLAMLMQTAAPAGGGGAAPQNATTASMIAKVTEYLSKSIREVTVTILWKRSQVDQTFTLSTYWINFNEPFSLF